MFKKIINWWNESHRWQHYALGIAVGLGANDWHSAGYLGVAVAGSLEFKDKQHGGQWDWIDFALTLAGIVTGYTVRWLILKALK